MAIFFFGGVDSQSSVIFLFLEMFEESCTGLILGHDTFMRSKTGIASNTSYPIVWEFTIWILESIVLNVLVDGTCGYAVHFSMRSFYNGDLSMNWEWLASILVRWPLHLPIPNMVWDIYYNQIHWGYIQLNIHARIVSNCYHVCHYCHLPSMKLAGVYGPSMNHQCQPLC